MANINLYATLAEYKAYRVSRGQSASTDTIDDGVIVDLLEKASRYIDEQTTRQFYPTIETHLYNIPSDSCLWLDQDLLSVITLTNGDAVAITSTDYSLLSPNVTPHYAIKLKDISSVAWSANSDGSSEQVISVAAWWGYRKQFAQRAWLSVGTLGAAITDTTTLAFTMTAGHTVVVGQILKIDNEIYNVTTVSSNTVTPIVRGDNGSTAATHLNGASVYRWVAEAKQETIELAVSAYERRFGKATGESATITAAGVVLQPRDVPEMVKKVHRSQD
jgi:hypothetical protein